MIPASFHFYLSYVKLISRVQNLSLVDSKNNMTSLQVLILFTNYNLQFPPFWRLVLAYYLHLFPVLRMMIF